MHQGPEVDLHVASLLPDDYLPDVHLRLVLYKRIAAAANPDELRELQVEMIDRFGLLPPPAKNLFRIAEFKQARAHAWACARSTSGPGGGSVTFEPDTRVDPGTLIRFVQQTLAHPSLGRRHEAALHVVARQEEKRFDAVQSLLDALAKPPPAAARCEHAQNKRAKG